MSSLRDAASARLDGKVILVIGGASGIGRATAELCAARGAAVAVADIDAEAAAETVAAWDGFSARVDVTHEASVAGLFGQLGERLGRLDALIQCAGVLKGAFVPAEEFPAPTWQTVLDVNLTGSYLCAKHAVPLLERSGSGVMVLVSSGAAVSGSSSIAYGASKGGVNALAVTLANQLGPRHIRVNVVMPGNIDTPMKRAVISADAERTGASESDVAAAANLGTSQGVARILAWLVSDDADYVRGAISTR
jgi:NAD(P)-dependent dehydrogenase (short-subunit alcohol dehydrogenase family)